ncbi:MAG: sulfurtransferase TusA family protein [Xanthomonadales bacterium]|nr:sulfurtransferase TusA family protein [Xanthomonadales bacterium]
MQLRKMNIGQTLYIIADDPNTRLDFEVYTMRSGHQLVASHTGTDGCFHYLIRKQARQPA